MATHPNKFKQITVKAPYEDGSGYAIFTYLVFDDGNLINKAITYGTGGMYPATTNPQELVSDFAELGIVAQSIIPSYTFKYSNTVYPDWTPTNNQLKMIDKLSDVFNLAGMPNTNIIFDKTFIMGNNKYRIHINNTAPYYQSWQYWSESLQSWRYFIIEGGGQRIEARTMAIRVKDIEDLEQGAYTTSYYYEWTTDYYIENIITQNYRSTISSSHAISISFVNDLLGAEQTDPTDPYNKNPGDLNSDIINDDITTGYMQYGDTNLFTIFVPTEAQLQDLAAKMYGQDLFTWLQGLGLSLTGVNDDIMNLYVLPATVSATGTKYISGNRIPLGSSVAMNYTNNNYVIVDCGSVSVPKLYNNFLDYTSQIQVYLPFVGYQSLDTEDVMGKTLNITYRIDLLTGDAAIAIKVDGSVMYQFQGNTAYGLPGAADHYSDIIQKGLTAATMIAVGKSAQNAGQTQISQSEDLYKAGKLNETEAGRMAATGEKEIARGKSLKQHAIGDLANIQFGGSTRSGAMGGNTGLLSVITPYLIIKRPKVEVPQNYGAYNGYPSNKYLNLGSLAGYTEVEEIHVENINATLREVEEIENLLKQGVIL